MIPSDAVAYLQQQTSYDEEVIGCFLHNYGSPRTCGAFRNGGCKDAARCKSIERTIARAIARKQENK